MAPVCTILGTPDLYGMGIRISFYLLWFFILIGERCHEHHAQVLRAVELVLAYSVFLGLAVAVSAGNVFAAEVYIALLLISTTVYLLVPRHTSDLIAWIYPDLGRTPARVLKEVKTFGGLTVACVLIAAIELTIKWNEISGAVDQVATAAQFIPAGIVIALILAFLSAVTSGSAESVSSGSSSNGSGSGSAVGSSGPSSSPGGRAKLVMDSRPWAPSSPYPSAHPPASVVASPPGTVSLDAAPEPVSNAHTPHPPPNFDKDHPPPGFDRETIHRPPIKPVVINVSPPRRARPKEHYLQTATSLHESATMRLAQAHADLSRQLTQGLAESDAAFLESAEAHVRKLAQPLDAVRIRSQKRGRDGALRSEESTVGELVARAEEQLREFEKSVAELWAEWAAADEEVKTLMKGLVSLSSSSSSSSSFSSPEGIQGGNEGMDTVGIACEEGEEMLRQFRKTIEQQIEDAEQEVLGLGEEAVALMKGIEKDFRKETLPDLHTFFQSIDEP
ncbi:hypothetical protein VTH82DRAFT_5803 [Thermothelomyces myriococcoides]